MDNQDKMLTTKDNPFNPHENYEQWLYYDTQQGYNTQSYIARVYSDKVEDPTSTDVNDELLAETLQEIIRMNPLGLDYVLI